MSQITHRLRRALGDSRHTLELLHRIGRVELFRRYHQGQPFDFAVVRGALTAHGATVAEALASLRATLQERNAEQQQELGWDEGIAAGFTPECLVGFCAANGLNPDQRLPLGELRRTVTTRRAANAPYAQQLRRVGIHLSLPKK
jgi:hypothetical protein